MRGTGEGEKEGQEKGWGQNSTPPRARLLAPPVSPSQNTPRPDLWVSVPLPAPRPSLLVLVLPLSFRPRPFRRSASFDSAPRPLPSQKNSAQLFLFEVPTSHQGFFLATRSLIIPKNEVSAHCKVLIVLCTQIPSLVCN